MEDLYEAIIKKPLDFKDFEVSSEAQELIVMMMKFNPDERATINQIMEHSWLKNQNLKT